MQLVQGYEILYLHKRFQNFAIQKFNFVPVNTTPRKINVNTAKAGVTIIFLNQLRSKVGVIYGNPEITTGGNALKFYASVRLDIRRKEIIKGRARLPPPPRRRRRRVLFSHSHPMHFAHA